MILFYNSYAFDSYLKIPPKAINQNKSSVNSDTVSNGNKIDRIINKQTEQIIYIKLAIYGYKDRPIKLSLINLIGKEVKVIYDGFPKDSDWEYTLSYADIPSGVYLCVLSSTDYRDAKKIVLSK